MNRISCFLFVALLTACGNSGHRQAEELLHEAELQYEQGHYERALCVIDSLRTAHPNAIETRRQALQLKQRVELERSQKELAIVDSALQVAISQYEELRRQAGQSKAALRATADELTRLTTARIYRDSLQTRFDVLCAKIRYIHKLHQKSSSKPKSSADVGNGSSSSLSAE